jgi:ABC-type dipeptide/oligopeptide/nickel transport system ATPase component
MKQGSMVESFKSERIFEAAHHPYTDQLLESIPTLDRARHRA